MHELISMMGAGVEGHFLNIFCYGVCSKGLKPHPYLAPKHTLGYRNIFKKSIWKNLCLTSWENHTISDKHLWHLGSESDSYHHHHHTPTKVQIESAPTRSSNFEFHFIFPKKSRTSYLFHFSPHLHLKKYFPGSNYLESLLYRCILALINMCGLYWLVYFPTIPLIKATHIILTIISINKFMLHMVKSHRFTLELLTTWHQMVTNHLQLQS